MRATKVQQVFQYLEWIVLVDAMDVFTGVTKSSNSESTKSKTFVNIQDYGMENILNVLWFQETFGSEVAKNFWAIHGYNSTTGLLMLAVM